MAKTKSRPSSKKKTVVKKSTLTRRQPKTSKLPILLTILTIVALGSFYIYRKMITPLGVNEVSSNSINCSQGFTDNFDGSNIDTSKWLVEINQDGEMAKIDDGKIELTSPTSNAVMRVLGIPAIQGNFTAEIDIYTPISTSSNEPSQYSQFVFREPTSQGNYAGITRNSDGQIMSYVFGGYYGDKGINQYSKYANIPKDVVVRSKIIREGTHLKIYYKTTGDYILLADYPDIADSEISMIPRINLGPIDGGPLNSTTAKFDNFTLSCITSPKPASPYNLSTTCTPDGKSVKFTWNGVESDSYKVRLDDKNGKVTNFDDVKQLQYITSVTPGKMYSFWVHSHKGDQDSNQSTAVDFTCNATATPTPTPKPTVKPTAKPTATPTVAPTPTPTTQAYVIASPKPSAFAYDNISTDTTTEEDVTTKSTNPLARFFTWLASLFE